MRCPFVGRTPITTKYRNTKFLYPTVDDTETIPEWISAQANCRLCFSYVFVSLLLVFGFCLVARLQTMRCGCCCCLVYSVWECVLCWVYIFYCASKMTHMWSYCCKFHHYLFDAPIINWMWLINFTFYSSILSMSLLWSAIERKIKGNDKKNENTIKLKLNIYFKSILMTKQNQRNGIQNKIKEMSK